MLGIRGARPRKNSFVMQNTCALAHHQTKLPRSTSSPPRQVAILKSGEKSANWPQNTVICRKQTRALWRSCVGLCAQKLRKGKGQGPKINLDNQGGGVRFNSF
jgi:hypothetical protein